MLILTSAAQLAYAAIDPILDEALRRLIVRCSEKLETCSASPLPHRLRVVVVEGGDTAEVINESVGFPITGEDAEESSYENIHDHGLWFEITYPRRGGVLTIVLVENTPATELGLHYLCLSHFWP